MATQFWKHNTSGEVFAVVIGDDGRVRDGSEALDYREYTTHSAEEFDTAPENAEWFNEHEAEFSLYEPQK